MPNKYLVTAEVGIQWVTVASKGDVYVEGEADILNLVGDNVEIVFDESFVLKGGETVDFGKAPIIDSEDKQQVSLHVVADNEKEAKKLAKDFLEDGENWDANVNDEEDLFELDTVNIIVNILSVKTLEKETAPEMPKEASEISESNTDEFPVEPEDEPKKEKITEARQLTIQERVTEELPKIKRGLEILGDAYTEEAFDRFLEYAEAETEEEDLGVGKANIERLLTQYSKSQLYTLFKEEFKKQVEFLSSKAEELGMRELTEAKKKETLYCPKCKAAVKWSFKTGGKPGFYCKECDKVYDKKKLSTEKPKEEKEVKEAKRPTGKRPIITIDKTKKTSLDEAKDVFVAHFKTDKQK